MALYSTPTNSGDSGHGFSWKTVRVQSVNKDKNVRVAICIDQFGMQMSVRCDIMKAKGALPDPGEQWIVERQYGQWIFGAIINASAQGVDINSTTDLPQTLDTNYYTRPTGSVELTIRTVPPSGALLMQGQTLSRTTYNNLWSFATTQDLVGSVFGVGDGSTTFTLPDCRGRVPRGVAATGDTIGSLLGMDYFNMSVGQLPVHNHGLSAAGTTSDDHHHEHTAPHTHDFTTDGAGGHSGHNAGADTEASALQGSQDHFFTVADSTQNALSNHTHSGTTGTDGVYSHTDYTHGHTLTGSTDSVGSNQTIWLMQNSFGVNWMIWI